MVVQFQPHVKGGKGICLLHVFFLVCQVPPYHSQEELEDDGRLLGFDHGGWMEWEAREAEETQAVGFRQQQTAPKCRPKED